MQREVEKSGENKAEMVIQTLMIQQASNPLNSQPITSTADTTRDLNIDASKPVNTHTSGIHDQTRLKLSAVFRQRRSTRRRRRRKHPRIEIVFSLSCPRKITNEKGMEVGKDGDANPSGSQTDPLHLHNKKRSRRKKSDVSPEEDIERLKAYYADVDAFDLPQEEVTSERDLE